MAEVKGSGKDAQLHQSFIFAPSIWKMNKFVNIYVKLNNIYVKLHTKSEFEGL